MKSSIFVSKQKAMARKSSPIKKSDTVQVNLMRDGYALGDEHWQAIKKAAVDLDLQGIGDGSKHNTLVYMLAEILGVNTDNIFSEKSGEGFVLHLPKEVSVEIDKEGKRYGLRKEETIATLIDIWIRKNKNNSSKNDMGDLVSTVKSVEEMKHYKTIEEFLIMNKKRGPVTRVGYNAAVRSGAIVPEEVPVVVMKKMIDTRKYGISNEGYKVFIKKDAK